MYEYMHSYYYKNSQSIRWKYSLRDDTLSLCNFLFRFLRLFFLIDTDFLHHHKPTILSLHIDSRRHAVFHPVSRFHYSLMMMCIPRISLSICFVFFRSLVNTKCVLHYDYDDMIKTLVGTCCTSKPGKNTNFVVKQISSQSIFKVF